MAAKTVRVFGAPRSGKKTLVGCLMYQCGGIGLPVLEQLEQAGVRTYEGIAPLLVEKGIEISFYAPSAKCNIGEYDDPAIAFYLVDVSSAEGTSSFVQDLADLLAQGAVRPVEKLIILANKMDLVDWSQQVFSDVAARLQAGLKGVSLGRIKTYIVPISAIRGDNLVEPCAKLPWFPGVTTPSQAEDAQVGVGTLMQAIEHSAAHA